MTASGETIQTPSSLGLWDTVSLLIGIVIGVSIFKVPPLVFLFAGSPVSGLLLWLLAGVLTFSGALCYAELSACYPQFGAQYVFLTRAYGQRVGFLFAWMQVCAVMTGSIGMMAFVFADYALIVFEPLASMPGIVAAVSLLTLLMIQANGLRTGRFVQNLLSASKVLALGALFVCGLWLPSAEDAFVLSTPPTDVDWQPGLALVFVLYAYGGWSDVAMVTPEVRDCRRTMPLALMLGLGMVTFIYLALNVAYLRSLGYGGITASQAPAADVIRLAWGSSASRVMAVMVMISALGAIHGMLFTGCRLLAAVGERDPRFQFWNRWTSKQVPMWSLATIGAISLLLIVAVGTVLGRDLISRGAQSLSLPDPEIDNYRGGFETLFAASAPIFWTFLLLSGLAVIVLRLREPDRPRPFRVPLYPITPLVFSASAGYMLWSSAVYAGKLMLLMAPVIVIGLCTAWRFPQSASTTD